MHLVDILDLRAVPAAGLSLALTRRCPLSCAHCATNSTSSSEEAPAELFRRFVGTFRPDDHPQVLAISGGEAFLRPALLRELAEQARTVGCRTFALSGMFWARGRRIPPTIRRAIDALDHFSASMDVFHEAEVQRSDVYGALETLLDDGMDVSIHLTGLDTDDPYLVSTTAELRRVFDDRVPILVNGVNYAVGRAQMLRGTPVTIGPAPIEAEPCGLSFWPLVAFDGTVVACGNDDVVDGPAPAHLRLGHAGTDSWPEIRARCEERAVLRAIRTVGPEYLAEQLGNAPASCTGYCATCQQLSDEPDLHRRVESIMAAPAATTLERYAHAWQRDAGATSFIRRYGMTRYADLVTLGAPT